MSRRTAKPPFETSDLYFAAYLKTAAVPMQAPRWLDERRKRCHFRFEDDGTGTIDRLKLEWVNNTGKVVGRGYADNIKALKSLCHN
jgi:hypothetical protein